ncbi:MAG: nucleoside 2-deoxyribosyltransferase [Candidatus Paceibacterota bacterium]
MKIYFAGSIRGGRDDRELYNGIITLLKKYGTVLTEHVGNENLSEKGETNLSDEAIFNRDIALLEKCDAIVAEVTTPSMGVGYEIGRIERNKPILCLFRDSADAHLSAMIAGNKVLSVKRYRSIEEIEALLQKFMDKISSTN